VTGAGAHTVWLLLVWLEVGVPARSLKEKRALLLPLLERWRKGMSLSVSRAGGLDAHTHESFVIAAVDTQRDRLQAVAEGILSSVAAAGLRVLQEAREVEALDPLEERFRAG
jgi:uncharacterized protein YlxP (DUF503 family)